MKGEGAPALWCPTTAAAISSMLGTSALKVTSRLVLSTTRDMAVLASLPQGMRKGLVVARGVARGEKRAVGGKLQHPVVEAFAVALDWSRLCPRFFLKYRFTPLHSQNYTYSSGQEFTGARASFRPGAFPAGTLIRGHNYWAKIQRTSLEKLKYRCSAAAASRVSPNKRLISSPPSSISPVAVRRSAFGGG